MKASKINVLIECDKKEEGNPGIRTISIQELLGWIKSGNYWRHLFRYKQSNLMINNWESLPEPFGTALAVYLLSWKTASIQMDDRKAMTITLPFLFRTFKSFLSAYFGTQKFLRQKLKELDHISGNLKTHSTGKALNMQRQPVYLRTDYALNLKAGGSVGHTAGVLNQLSNFAEPPLFITSTPIPTVDKEIETHTIPPSGRFMDFLELMNLDYNDRLRQATQGLLENRSPAFIYQRYSTNNYFGIELAQRLKIPIILEYNGSEVWVNKNWGKALKYEAVTKKIELLNLNAADVVVVVSQPLKDELTSRGVDPEKILVNPNGVNPEVYSPEVDGSTIRRMYKLEDKMVIGFIGTFGKWHGAEILAHAFGLLLQKYPQYRDKTRLLMIGDGNTLALVRQHLETYGVSQECILTGIVPQEEGPSHLAACDLLASPHVPNPDGTPFFGSPTKLFEYMAMGKGIIASNLDQIGEILEHNGTAWMVKPGDAESLMMGLKALVDDPETSKRLGEAARREAVGKYTWKEHTRKIIEKLKERCPCN